MTTTNNNYQQLKEMVNTELIQIHLILSPPRTGSTLLEAVMSQSQEIHATYHEPFVSMGYYGQNSEEGYGNILDLAHSELEKGQRVNILVKEMSHWLDTDSEYKRFLQLVKTPVVFMIRNPLLAMESRIRKVIQVCGVRERPNLIDSLSSSLRIPIHDYQLPTQRHLLDEFSRESGYKDWDDFTSERYTQQDYTVFGEILKVKGLFPTGNSGWESLSRIHQYISQTSEGFVVVDSTEFRFQPHQIISDISRRWGLAPSQFHQQVPYSVDGLNIRMNKPHYKLWYDSLLLQNRIRPPTEPIPRIGSFPDDIRDYLAEIAIPVFVELFSNPNRIEGNASASSPEGVLNTTTLDPYIGALQDPQRFNAHTDGSFQVDAETWAIWKRSYQQICKVEGDFRGRRL